MLLITRIFFIIIIIGCLSACSIFSPVRSTEQNTYVINKLPQIQPASKQTRLSLLVKTTSTNSIYNTKNMAYISKPYQVAYFVNNRWADKPTEMLSLLISQALQDQKYYQAIVTSAYSANYDRILNIKLLELKQNFLSNPSAIHLAVHAELLDSKTKNIIASKQFNIIEPATEDTPYGGVVAANKAAAQLINKLVLFSNH